MRTPDHAAVSETVAACEQLGKKWAKGLFNAVLREFLRKKEATLDKVDKNLTAKFSHPKWLLEKIKSAWPDHWQEILSANNDRPPLTLRINLAKISRDDYLKQLSGLDIEASEHKISQTAVTLAKPISVFDIPGFSDGIVSVQDAASQLAAELIDLKPGLRILDACAAPGGKAAHILECEAELEELIALDIDERRLGKVKQNFKRIGLHGKLLCGDAANPPSWWDGQQFDRILLDAPCSATGIIRRHPDIKWLRKESDIKKLALTQMQMLAALWPLLKQGGMLLYSTCSILPTENAELIAHFLDEYSDASEIPINKEWGVALPKGRQLLPGLEDTDGFFYARLQKQTA